MTINGIQAVGVVLMAAMLITPAAAARFWTQDVFVMVILAAVLGAFSGLAGAYVSFTAPTMPTGPWIVMIISIIALLSFFLAPERGIISRAFRQQRQQRVIMDENLLKELYHLGEKDNNNFRERSLGEINEERYFPARTLRASLGRLKRKGYVKKKQDKWSFTAEGRQKGQRVVKLHRLWEMYLSEHMNIDPDHVHEDAETIEHVITPELEARLEHLLEYPAMDPHDKEIPYS